MYRSVLAIFAGIIGGSVVIWSIEAIGHLIGTGPLSQDYAAASSGQGALPVVGLVLVLFGYAAGAFSGGWIAVAISEKVRDGFITGLTLLFFDVLSVVIVHYPLWFVLVSFLVYIPFAYWGGKLRSHSW